MDEIKIFIFNFFQFWYLCNNLNYAVIDKLFSENEQKNVV